jgi:hypothetical protein
MGRRGKSTEAVEVPEHTHDFDHKHRRVRGRRLAFLLAVVGGIVFAMRRKQNRDDLDEGVWHEAPTS